MKRFNILSLAKLNFLSEPEESKDIEMKELNLKKNVFFVNKKYPANRYADIFVKPSKQIPKKQWIQKGFTNLLIHFKHWDEYQLQMDQVMSEIFELFDSVVIDNHSFPEAFCCFTLMIKMIFDEDSFPWQYRMYHWGAELCSCSSYHLIFIEKEIVKKMLDQSIFRMEDAFG